MFADRLFLGLEKRDIEPGSLLLSAPMPDGAYDDYENPGLHQRSPMLVLQYNEEVTIMARLDRRSEEPALGILPSWSKYIAKPQVVYMGGDTNRDMIHAIGVVKPDASQPDRTAPLGNFLVVDVNSDPNETHDGLQGIRLFRGFFVVPTEELHAQIDNGDWYVTTALVEDIFASGQADVWGEAMRRQEFPLPLFANYPGDLNDV